MNIFNRAAAIVATALSLSLLLSSNAPAQTASSSKDKVAMGEARAIVLELPEVKAWQEARRKAAEVDRKSPASGGILTGTRTPQGKKHWSVTLYTNPATQPEKFATFLVRASDGKVFVEGEGGKPVSLEQWRRVNTKPAS